LFFDVLKKFDYLEGNAMECRDFSGFTLVELLVSVSISCVLLTQAIPAFIDYVRGNRLATQTHHFVSAVNFARTEAINRNMQVIICVRSGSSCDNSNYWEQGWIIFYDPNGNTQVDNGEVVRVFEPLKTGFSLQPNVTSNSLRFYPDGAVRRASKALPLMTFRLCAPDAGNGNLAQRSREIVINATGRMRLQFGREIAGAC